MCRRLHQCGAKGRGCKHRFLWLESEAFGSKCGGSKRNLYCNECTALAKKKNAINNPINSPIYNAAALKAIRSVPAASRVESVPLAVSAAA